MSKVNTPTKNSKLFWVKSATKVPFLREWITVTSRSRTQPIKLRTNSRQPEVNTEVYAYELLPKGTSKNEYGRYTRKVYVLKHNDLVEYADTIYTPAEAKTPVELDGKGRKSPGALLEKFK